MMNAENVGLSKDVIKQLICAANEARKYSYTPYSNFQVGAALLAMKKDKSKECSVSENGNIITGCNIENAAYSTGNCAERTAVFKAVSEGYTNFRAIAIVGGKGSSIMDYTSPCGMCRQVLREFVDIGEFLVIMAKTEEDYIVKTLEELLPMSFGPDNLHIEI